MEPSLMPSITSCGSMPKQREIKVFSVLNKLRQKNRVKDSSQKIKNVPERIGDRLDALETKIEEILDRLK